MINNQNKKYDLEERTAIFAERVINLCQRCPKTVLIIPLLSQLIRAATSIGANYCEANGASSKKDFRNKIHICKKEAKETQYWLRIIGSSVNEERLKEDCRILWQEAKELSMIFATIAAKTN